MVEEILYVSDQSANAWKGTTTDRFAREDAEPSLDEVEPGGSCWGEVKVNSRMFLEPCVDFCGLVG